MLSMMYIRVRVVLLIRKYVDLTLQTAFSDDDVFVTCLSVTHIQIH